MASPDFSEQEKTALREMLDREAITDCIHRYSRGVDRMDKELTCSVYHPDGIDNHGWYKGQREGFREWAKTLHDQAFSVCPHHVTNISIEIDGDTAHAETYWFMPALHLDGQASIHGGRYLDRMEKRNGRWAIAYRACLTEWGMATTTIERAPEDKVAIQSVGVSARDKTDLSYQRPLGLTK